MKTKCKRNQFFMYKSKLVAVCFRRGDDFGDFKCISYSKKKILLQPMGAAEDLWRPVAILCILHFDGLMWGVWERSSRCRNEQMFLGANQDVEFGEQQAIKGVLLSQTPNLSLLRQNRNLMMVHKVRAHESQSLASECDTVHSHRVQPRAPVYRPAANRSFLHTPITRVNKFHLLTRFLHEPCPISPALALSG